MNQTSPPTLESELLTGLYSDEEKAQILGQIEEAASANRLTADTGAFSPRKSGILFPVAVNLAAVVLIVVAWFGANAYFQNRQEGLRLRTDKLFSTESKLLAKVLEDSKAQLAAKNNEINKIQDQLKQMAAEKSDLQKSFEDRVTSRERQLRKELADTLAAEKQRLEDQGYGPAEVARKLKEFETLKEAEFTTKLADYRSKVQAEIDQRTQAVNALQAKLQSTVTEQEQLRKDIEKQTKAREQDLQTQLASQAADLNQLKKDKDDLTQYYRQTDVAMAAVRTAFDAGDWSKTQAAVQGLREILARASASASEAVRTRALAETAMAATLDNAAATLSNSSSKSESEALKEQAKKDQALAALQVAALQKSLADTELKWHAAQAQTDSLRKEIDDLVAKLDESTGRTLDVKDEEQSLEAQVAALERDVDELIPFRTRAEALQKLFASDYPTAKERFEKTFRSDPGQTAFPGFDSAWNDLNQETKDAQSSGASRKQALDQVLNFTTYLRGSSSTASTAKIETEKLTRTDPQFKDVVDSIQSLSISGFAESAVNTSLTQLYGTVTTASKTKLLLEPLTKVKPNIGQLIEIRRVEGTKETVLGRGPVLTSTDQKTEVDWTGNPTPALYGDAAYVVLP